MSSRDRWPDRGARSRPTRRAVLGSVAATGAALAMPAVLRGQAASSDGEETLLTNGRFVTLDAARPRASAVLIRDGIIAAVGDDDLAGRALASARRIDLGGRTVVPGLNDNHLHLTRGARYYGYELRWDGVGSLARGLEMVAEQAARTPPGQWLRVMGGWSRDQFAERRLPTPADLTEAAPATPVFVLYLYSRGFLNAAGVRALGLTPDNVGEKAMPGARYELTDDGGAIVHAEPSAMLINTVIGSMPQPTPEEERSSAPHFYRELARFGLTSAIDLGGGGHAYPENYVATRRMAESGEMPIRITNFLPPQVPGEELEIVRRFTGEYAVNFNMAERLRHGFEIGGMGEALAVSAYDFENFMAPRPSLDDRPGWRDDLAPILRHLLEARWPIRVHATYDETIRRIMDVFETAHAEEVNAGRAGLHGIRWAIEHAETIRPETIARVAALGGGVALQDRMAFAGEVFAERYGEEAAADAPPIADLVAAGVPIALGTDGTRVASYNPWVALAWAVTGRTVGGAPLMAERHRRSRLEALQLYTTAAAWFSGEEGLKGRIAPGQFADLAVLDRDYLAVPDGEIASIESLLTICGGRTTHAAGPFDGLAPELPAIMPEWSPVRAFGGYRNG